MAFGFCGFCRFWPLCGFWLLSLVASVWLLWLLAFVWVLGFGFCGLHLYFLWHLLLYFSYWNLNGFSSKHPLPLVVIINFFVCPCLSHSFFFFFVALIPFSLHSCAHAVIHSLIESNHSLSWLFPSLCHGFTWTLTQPSPAPPQLSRFWFQCRDAHYTLCSLRGRRCTILCVHCGGGAAPSPAPPFSAPSRSLWALTFIFKSLSLSLPLYLFFLERGPRLENGAQLCLGETDPYQNNTWPRSTSSKIMEDTSIVMPLLSNLYLFDLSIEVSITVNSLF